MLKCDVAIIGGGPAGATAATLLKKYAPHLSVAVFERESFPRDHVGESHLPVISNVLEEMGCWDKVEAANFPIKIGATYRWGKTKELWDFEFLPARKFVDEARPAKFVGQRRKTAFQVDRAIYDKILLDHAAEMGTEVHQNAKVIEVHREGDRVTDLKLADGEAVEAQYYVDASGHGGILRRAMGVNVEYPSSLQNIAIWDYWQNAEWAVEIGVGGTRIQVISLGYGWIWFIPIAPTRTSIGLVLPAQFYKQSGKRPEDLYSEALKGEPYISGLLEKAKAEGRLSTTKDWSFMAERHSGDNWFLVGESGGFADPILSAGMSMAHYAGREAAATIIELVRGELEPNWLRSEYDRHQAQRITSHIRFADYWYTANEQFVDLKKFTSELARERGLELSPEKAWAWLSAGGFIDEDFQIGIAGFSITAIRAMGEFFGDANAKSPVETCNVFVLDLKDAILRDSAHYGMGSILREKAYFRDGRILPVQGVFEFLLYVLQRSSKLPDILARIKTEAEKHMRDPGFREAVLPWIPQGLEAMISDGWVRASFDPALPIAPISSETDLIHWNRDYQASSLKAPSQGS